jgi:gas vesicle protein
MRDSGKLIVALLTAVAAGAALGILFAPDKGFKTRRKIADASRKFSDSIQDTAEEGMEAISELKEKLYNKAEQVSQKFKI